ncbi:putative ferredoxin reductase [Gordonia araii NBRC 100433]|uniref:Putative ferredoxin reductase n=1 Tax=Gordonia araii NBRC 100433 TaxID=1073574 RepID=G7GZA1_9ACTN|nr:FAD-dependent oxidoreductase [Gordonia araii]NNG98638.1 FAD-dependent oxidoreductase [Gordonia araii NBRC 100433]GAB08926.1 putative ferredoxin reductase [Gordonia araii NBRC 100433]
MSERLGSGATVVVVGAGLGGVRVAENLRTGGHDGPIVMIGAEAHPPYDRPPLSKNVLTDATDRVDLKPEAFYGESSIELRTGEHVDRIDPAEKTLTVTRADGSSYQQDYDALVLATGLDPRPFPGAEDVAGVYTLRRFDDALALRDAAAGATAAVVIGAGFIGCETAASLHTLGLTVTLVEPAPTPLAQAVGTEIGALVTRQHNEKGVSVRAGIGVDEIVAEGGKVSGVKLSDGEVVPADLVVVGIGSTPVVGYLDGSGIELASREVGGGIACNEVGRTSADDVYALGDVANWRDHGGAQRRVEHWNHTVEQAAIVGAALLGTDHAVVPAVPYFWSDQYDLKIQVLGWPKPDDDVHIVDDDGHKWLAYFSRDGMLTAVAGAGKVGAVMKTRPKLVTPTPIDEVLPG